MQRLWSSWYKKIIFAIPLIGKPVSTPDQPVLDELSLEGSSLTAPEGQAMTQHRAIVTGPVTGPTAPQPAPIEMITLPVTTTAPESETSETPIISPKQPSPFRQVLTVCGNNISLLVLGFAGATMMVGVGIGYVFLTTPKAITEGSKTCQSQIIGSWQTAVGVLQLQPAANGTDAIIGKYQYDNSVQGNVTGQITGTLDQNVMNFTWQETAKLDDSVKNSPSQTRQGKGILFFSPNCREMSGSSGSGDEIKGHRRWEGSWQVPKTAPKPQK
ncbi:MAG: hypothetical protein WCO45_10195 [Pseudanabaena sp. ELA607]